MKFYTLKYTTKNVNEPANKYVTGFANKILYIHPIGCVANLACAFPIALKFGSRTLHIIIKRKFQFNIAYSQIKL